MLDEQDESTTTVETATSTSSTGTPIAADSTDSTDSGDSSSRSARTAKKAATTKKATAKKAAKKATSKKAAKTAQPADAADDLDPQPTKAAKKATKKSTKNAAKKAPKKSTADDSLGSAEPSGSAASETDAGSGALAMPLFRAPDPEVVTTRSGQQATADSTEGTDRSDQSEDAGEEGGAGRRRRSRGGRNRRKAAGESADEAASSEALEEAGASDKASDRGKKPAKSAPKNAAKKAAKKADKGAKAGADESAEAAGGEEETGTSRRRRRRRRSGEDTGTGQGEQGGTTTKVRQPRAKKESITSVEGSTRIEAKKQRRREGREAGRRRPPILSESEFLARRESVDRVMAIRQRGETTQIAVLEDDVLVEHYVALESQNSLIGNVYLGRVQNVLPSMEAAFIDIGKGRNAVLYAGEVNWDLRGDRNQPRRIENALKPGQSVLVQVSKDPIGHKGARLTSQISLPGRYLVFVPGGGTSGISRKLPDTERNRLKNLLKDILPEDAGVIIRTAAEGASEEELTRDVTRLTARWADIEKKSSNGQAPQLLYAEPDTTLKVVRDLFTEDFSKLVISGDDAWDMVDAYVQHVAPDLADRLERFDGDKDVFDAFRIDEQIAKALERKVWLPSGGSLVIDRTEAMTVVDVNTGKFTGSGGNLEETVTKNNLEAAEEIVRQLRLRDIGGIIVVDFIDMVLENNRDLVLRRLVECLGRDRTRHQVAEVTSLGLVQMTRKRISTGLLEAFSHACEHCQGRGVIIEGEPVEAKKHDDHQRGSETSSRTAKRSSNRRRGRRGGGDDAEDGETTKAASTAGSTEPSESAESVEAPDVSGTSESPPAVDASETAAQAEQDSAAASAGPAETIRSPMPVPRGSETDELPSATTPRSRRRRRASRPTGAPSSTSS